MGTKPVSLLDYDERLPEVKLDDPLTRHQREVTKQAEKTYNFTLTRSYGH